MKSPRRSISLVPGDGWLQRARCAFYVVPVEVDMSVSKGYISVCLCLFSLPNILIQSIGQSTPPHSALLRYLHIGPANLQRRFVTVRSALAYVRPVDDHPVDSPTEDTEDRGEIEARKGRAIYLKARVPRGWILRSEPVMLWASRLR